MVRLIIDSGSDISKEEATKWGIDVLPLKITFGENDYLDGANITHDDFFCKLIESEHLPTTSQISPYDYEQVFKQVVDAGDTGVCITLASKLSGCYQSACIASEEFGDKIVVVDSESVCVGERILLEYALVKRNEGLSANEIAKCLEEKKKEVILLARLNTLEYLKKGGRISATTAGVGTILSIKPVVTLKDGEIQLLGAARGSKNANNKLMELVKSTGGIDFNEPFALAYSGLSNVELQKYIEDSVSIYSEYEGKLPTFTIGAAIGTHVGPGAIAIAFFGKK